ncbi:pyrroloquinoline quinone precursor peptide PqqA [Teichococcus aestuarii]|nr:pyrroloquinoline quinone precursor peptide PqqA [Pseudoroseomonas aestuarii]
MPARAASRPDRQEALMKRWTKPRIVTLCTGMEINSYATAE